MKWRQATFRKRLQTNNSKDDPRSQKKDEDYARNVYQKLKQKNKQTEMNNTLEAVNSRITKSEKWISDLEDRMVEIAAAKQNTKKRMKRNEGSVRDPWDIKHTKIHIIGVPEREEREKGHKKIFEKNISRKNFSQGSEILLC